MRKAGCSRRSVLWALGYLKCPQPVYTFFPYDSKRETVHGTCRENLVGASHDSTGGTLEERFENLVLSLEMVMDGVLSEAAEALDDVCHRGVLVAALHKGPLGYVEDLLDRRLRVLIACHGHLRPYYHDKHTMSGVRAEKGWRQKSPTAVTASLETRPTMDGEPER